MKGKQSTGSGLGMSERQRVEGQDRWTGEATGRTATGVPRERGREEGREKEREKENEIEREAVDCPSPSRSLVMTAITPNWGKRETLPAITVT